MTCLKSTIVSILLLGSILFSASASAQTPARFDFIFEDPGSPATAAGFIVFDLDLLPNPGATGFLDLPDPLVIDLEVTVSGAAAGNGTYVLEDFAQIIWDSGGVPLDVAPGIQVVGQPTFDGTWGDAECFGQGPEGLSSGCGDFNLFTTPLFIGPLGVSEYGARGPINSGPQGFGPFILAANGGSGELMNLTSFIRGPAGPTAPSFAVPTMSPWSIALFAALLLVFGGLAVRLRG